MKIAMTIIAIMAFGMLIFNATRINFNAPLEGESMVAVIGVVCSLCALVLFFLYKASKKVETLTKK